MRLVDADGRRATLKKGMVLIFRERDSDISLFEPGGMLKWCTGEGEPQDTYKADFIYDGRDFLNLVAFLAATHGLDFRRAGFGVNAYVFIEPEPDWLHGKPMSKGESNGRDPQEA